MKSLSNRLFAGFIMVFLGLGLFFTCCSKKKEIPVSGASKAKEALKSPSMSSPKPVKHMPVSPVTIKANRWMLNVHSRLSKEHPGKINNIAMLGPVKEGIDIMTTGLSEKDLKQMAVELEKSFKKEFPAEETVIRFYVDGKKTLTYNIKK